ncbi:HK97 gp10 family phage protein [Lysinibacillus agricola]|uniref:HK97 gp10 family phage protein n=1 Tax=Lysinibacillus agricola TaxID=2590012 RepID=UPI003C1CC39C
MASIDITQLANEISRQLELYAGVVEEDIDVAAKKVSKEGEEKLKQTSPEGTRGEYATGWTIKKQGKNYILWNAEHYQLTHLLEKGHATRDGGRTQAQPHIKPVEQKMIKDFEKEVIKAVEGR